MAPSRTQFRQGWTLRARNRIPEVGLKPPGMLCATLYAPVATDGQRRPQRYVVSAYMKCGFCATRAWRPEHTRPVYTVVGDRIVGVAAVIDPDTTRAVKWLDQSVDALFLEIKRRAEDPTRQVSTLVLHPFYGYPMRWSVDDARNDYGRRFVTDQEYEATVLFFAPDPVERQCGLWSRLMRRCR
ncbi:MAG: hypothetical protein M3Z54_08525 [Gemmatimonadota bacterium]|nr:hypothetical protein [Gemmatimonadota bacterium]